MARLVAIVSGGVHAGLLAWLNAVDFAAPVIEPEPPIAIEIVAPPPVIAAATTGDLGGETITAIATKSRGAAEHAAPTTDVPAPTSTTRSPYLDMRRGTARPDLSLPATARDVPVPATAKSPAPDVKRNNDLGSFTAHVDKDGGVTLRDRPDVSMRWAVPTPKIIGRGIAEWYESDKGTDGQRGKQTLAGELSGTVDQPTTGCQGSHDNACSPDRSRTIIVPVLRGGFNPTDWIMRRTVGDPYASKKRAYLDATREDRAQVRATHRVEQQKRTAELVRANLERAWASTTDLFTRKTLLFELWDEIADAKDDDSAAAEASRAARAQVIGFIRARLPQRGVGAYSPAEIAAFNKRKQSSETFTPYE